MKIIILAPGRDLSAWIRAFEDYDDRIHCFTSVSEARDQVIDIAVLWHQHPGDMRQLQQVNLISSMGAGVDHIMSDPDIPLHTPVVRLLDQALIDDMAEYALLAVFSIRRQWLRWAADKAHKRWQPYQSMPKKPRVGIVGMGVIGQAIAAALIQQGYHVTGLNRSKKPQSQVNCLTLDQKAVFFQQVDIVINVLPSTPDTHEFYHAKTFAQFKPGAWFINMGRGAQVNEQDLATALDTHLGGAILDVFATEPLPESSALWHRDNLIITPHVAAITQPASAVKSLMANYQRLKDKQPLLYAVDRTTGY